MFLAFIRASRAMKLVDADTICLDGMTIRASNGRKQSTSVEMSQKKLDYAHSQLRAIRRYMKSMDEEYLHENRIDHPYALDLDKDRLPSIAKPEDIQSCLHAGVLPDCYEGTNIRIQTQSLSQISCFIRHKDGRVTCPMGRELFRKRETKYGVEYSSREACRTCPNRCTDSKHAKHVNIGNNSAYVPVIMYGDPRYPLQQISDVHQKSPHNNFDKLKRAEKRVMLFIKRDISKQKLRQRIGEHPFGTIKHADGARYFLCRGKEKVTAEFALSALAYDLRRAINLCGGVQPLIEPQPCHAQNAGNHGILRGK